MIIRGDSLKSIVPGMVVLLSYNYVGAMIEDNREKLKCPS